jgi:23S rRNA-/tRNA-specific pseudouridylate synthase
MWFWAFNGLGLGLLLPNAQSLIADYFSGAASFDSAAIARVSPADCLLPCRLHTGRQHTITLHLALTLLQP